MKKKLFFLNFVIPVIFFITGFCNAQNTNFSKVLNALGEGNHDTVLFELQQIDTSKVNDYDKATWLYYYADYNFTIDNHHLAYKSILQSKKIFKTLNKDKDVADCNILLLNILSHQNNLKTNIQAVLDELKQFALKENDTSALITLYQRIAVQYLNNDKGIESINYFNKIIELSKLRKDTLKIAKSYMNIGTVHNTVLNATDSALYYTQKAVPILKEFNDYTNLAYNYNNQAQQYKLLKKYDKAIDLYLKADSIHLKENIAKSKVIFYENLSDAYLLNNDFKNAATYLNKLNKLKDSINDIQQNIAISEIKEQYDNEKLRADNLEIESKRKQNRNLLFGALCFILFGGVTSVLIQKNTKRKQLLAEQEKALETEKLATVLKEQELTAIDAMIEGQEKERQLIANDLHDELGGLMTTIKWNFNALKEAPTEDLYAKTNQLLDNAYQKVRSIAHTKNSGVIANKGLIKAIKDLATTISSSKKLHIEVVDFGFDIRIENSLELTIFRIIQELVTNIIKHAKATEATINITNHEETINIMVEDNGKGFNPKKIAPKKGMGIHSIDKRVENLGGTVTIESEINKGTTVIIDIPI